MHEAWAMRPCVRMVRVLPGRTIDVKAVHNAAGWERHGDGPPEISRPPERMRRWVPVIKGPNDGHTSRIRDEHGGKAKGDRHQHRHGVSPTIATVSLSIKDC